LQQALTLNPLEPLDPARHNRHSFTSGVKRLDDFLQKQARKESPDLSLTFVLTCEEEVGEIMGYYSISATLLRADDLPPKLLKKIGHYGAVPATLLGRLAVAEKYQGNKHLRIGEKLLIDAMLKAYRASRSVASFGMIVDVLVGEKGDPTGFYEKFGFLKCTETAAKMYLPMKTIENILKAVELI
jgi:predicted N-acetyltransferase YhbS